MRCRDLRSASSVTFRQPSWSLRRSKTLENARFEVAEGLFGRSSGLQEAPEAARRRPEAILAPPEAPEPRQNHVKYSKKHWFYKVPCSSAFCSQSLLRTPQTAPKIAPAGPQHGPGTAQEGPRSRPKAPRSGPEGPRSRSDGPKTVPGAAHRSSRRPRSRPEAPKTPPGAAPRPSQASKTP